MPKVTCLEPIGVEGGETYNAGEEYDVSADVLKEYGWAFSKPAGKTKKDASPQKTQKNSTFVYKIAHNALFFINGLFHIKPSLYQYNIDYYNNNNT